MRRCRAPLGAGEGDGSRRPRRPWRGRRRRRLPTAVTARTRPPAVTSRASGSRRCRSGGRGRPALEGLGADDDVTLRGRLGVPGEAITTATAAPDFHTGRGTDASVPVAAPTSRGERGESSNARIGWVSGSPKRALNSTTRRPRDVRARPAYSRPWNGVRAAPSRRRRLDDVALIWRPGPRAPTAAVCRRPCRPCWVLVAVEDPLEVLGRQHRHDRRPVAEREHETSGPSRYSSTITCPHAAACVKGRVAVVGDHDALAGREAVVLHDVRRANASGPRRPRRPSAQPGRGGRHSGGRHHVLGERLRALELGGRARTARSRDARCGTASATPATSGASGPTTTRSAPTTASAATARRPSGRPRAGSHGRMPGLPGAACTSLTAGSRASADQGVLAPAGRSRGLHDAGV